MRRFATALSLFMLCASFGWALNGGGGGGGSGGSGVVTLGGVVTGSSAANVFNSVNTTGNTMDNAFIIDNSGSNNNGNDLEIQPDAGESTLCMDDTNRTCGTQLQSYPNTTGTEASLTSLGDNSNNSESVALLCDSLDSTGAGTIPGFCYISGLGGKGFQAPFFAFLTIFSAGGTALPAAATGNAHWRACVSDSLACASGTTYTSGHSTPCEVWSNGSNWIESGSGC